MIRTLQLLLAFCLSSHSVHPAKNGKSGSSEFPKPVIEKIEGWTIEFDPALKKPEQHKLLEEVKKAMANHLQRIVYILPSEKTEALRKLIIRVDLEHKLTNMQYHPSKSWLNANGHDPSLEKRVHVPRARCRVA